MIITNHDIRSNISVNYNDHDDDKLIANILITNMQKYNYLFEEEENKKKQKKEEQDKEQKAHYGPAKTIVQTLYDNAGNIVGGVGGVYGVAKTAYDIAKSVKKATDLSPETINTIGNIATKVYKHGGTVAEVTNVLSTSQIKRQKARERLIRKALTMSEAERGVGSDDKVSSYATHNVLESFGGQNPMNTGFGISPTNSQGSLHASDL